MALSFFWRQAIKRSTFLDIETTGLDPSRHAPVGAALGRFGAPIQETWFTYETAERTIEGPWYRKFSIKTEEQMVKLMEPFARREWMTSWKEARRGWLQRGGVPTPARKYFSKVLAREARAGRFLWTHNVRFDITQFGSQFAHPAAARKMYEGAVVPGWTKFDPYSGRVFPTTTKTAHDIKGLLYEKPQAAPKAMRQWYGEYRQMVKQAVKQGKPAVLDSLAIAQAMMGMAQQQGAMRYTGDVFTGTSVEALATAFGVKAGGKAHLATTDVATMQRVLPRLLQTTEALYKGKKLKGWQAGALRYLGEVQPEIAKRNVERMFAQAVAEHREVGKYRLTRGGYSTNLDDLVGIYKKFYKHRSYYFEGMLEETMERMKGLSDEAISHIQLERARIPQIVGAGTRINVVRSEFGANLRRFLAGRNPYLLAGAAALGVAAIGGWLLPDRKEHNTVEGLRHEGFKGFSRRIVTDFGSGYNVDAPRIHPDILMFREKIWSNDLLRGQIQDEVDRLQKAYQARLGVFKKKDLMKVDATALEGINWQREDIRLVNRERFNIQVEDADTVFLERKGWLNWLKARFGYGKIALRLSGVDAPEIKHEDDPLYKLGLRWNEAQPYGEEARRLMERMVDEDTQIIVGAEERTYGRYIAALMDKEGHNINIELLRQGGAEALPWGKAEKELVRRDIAQAAESEAMDEGRGMWGYARYHAQDTLERMKNENVTFNMLTRIDVLAQRPSLAVMATQLAGLGDQGVAPYLRHMVTDFGSEYQAVMAISKWALRFEEGATAKYLTQLEVKDLLVYLKSQVENSKKLRIGRSSFGLEMSEGVMAENLAAIKKLEAAQNYKGGAMFLQQEHFAAIPDRRMRVEEIKRSILHESVHSAAANKPGMRRSLREIVPQNMIDIMEIEGYGSVKGSLGVTESNVARRARLEEESAAYILYPETAGIEGIRAGAENALRDVDRASKVDELRRMHQAFVNEVPVQQVRLNREVNNARRSRMKMNTQKNNAPAKHPNVRTNDSPHVPGMVQGMHMNRKRSSVMYQ